VAPLGYAMPLAVKRGYHRHFKPIGRAMLTRPVVDAENGFLITPMEAGIRLTTGIEFADRDAPPTPVQIDRDLPLARQIFPLGEPVGEIWMGRRPSFPDALPVICAAERHKGLWFDFGHGHLGFTLGPPSGRLLADLITGTTPFADPVPFSATRFDKTTT
jgi:D-amino-acid dehydrogenase